MRRVAGKENWYVAALATASVDRRERCGAIAELVVASIMESLTPSHVIIAAGLPRSGSTWQFNAARLLSAEAYGSAYGAWCKLYDASRPEHSHIVKVHDPADLPPLLGNGIVITWYRDPRDVVASMRRMAWDNNRTEKYAIKLIERYMKSLQSWSQRAVRVMRYEEMIADRRLELTRTAKALGFDFDAPTLDRVQTALEEMRPPQPTTTGNPADADTVTLLHPGHISTERYVLDEKIIAQIEERWGSWLSEHDYGSWQGIVTAKEE